MNAEEAEFYAWRGYAKFLLSKDRKQSFEECASDCLKALKMVQRCCRRTSSSATWPRPWGT